MSSVSGGVNLCSIALARLGDKPISSFNDPSQRAGQCAVLYPSIRDELLRSHPWNCARKRVILAPTVDTPAFDYPYQFQLPPDWARTIQVGRRGDSLTYAQEGMTIMAFVQQLPLVYGWLNTNESTWDGTLTATVIDAMTAVLAYPVTQSASMAQLMEQKFQDTFKRARAVNGLDAEDETLGDFPLLMSRLHSYIGVPGR
jgi:hypothetical protein